MRSLIAISLALALSAASEGRLPRQSGLKDVPRSDWLVAVFHTENHFKAQRFGFGQQKTSWKVFKITLYRKDPFRNVVKKTLEVKDLPYTYYDGKEHWWYDSFSGRWGKSTRFSAKKLFHKESHFTHDPE